MLNTKKKYLKAPISFPQVLKHNADRIICHVEANALIMPENSI